jgi:hypothetical protein
MLHSIGGDVLIWRKFVECGLVSGDLYLEPKETAATGPV